MACNTCSKSFSFLRPEKGCPRCGFSYCSKCLNNKLYLEKLNAEVKVCVKCKQASNNNEPNKVEPPDAYYKRIGAINDNLPKKEMINENATEQEIYERLKKLKEDKKESNISTNEDITSRLQKLKGDIPSTSTAELESRLANIKGVPISAFQSQSTLPGPDLRTEQEQADDLLKQYVTQANIDTKYKDEFDELVNDIETRLKNLKASTDSTSKETDNNQLENEDEMLKKIIERAKVEASLEDSKICDSTTEELPFCEICNEDARMRCLGCKYLFCTRCFIEHKDDDDGCNKYELYSPRA